MKRKEVASIIAGLQSRPDVWRLVHSEPLDELTARRSGAIARAIRHHGLPCPEHVQSRSETTNGARARVWAIFITRPTGWQHKAHRKRADGRPLYSAADPCAFCGLPSGRAKPLEMITCASS